MGQDVTQINISFEGHEGGIREDVKGGEIGMESPGSSWQSGGVVGKR